MSDCFVLGAGGGVDDHTCGEPGELLVGDLDLAGELILAGHEDSGVVAVGMIYTFQVLEYVVFHQNLGLDTRNREYVLLNGRGHGDNETV